MSGNIKALNDALFKQLDRLQTAEGEDLEREIDRSKAVSSLAGNVIANNKIVIDAARIMTDGEVARATGTTVQMLLDGKQ